MSGGLSILHISDLHYSKNHSTDLELLIEPLLVDIEAMVLKYQRPDCIIFSGDLVQNPDEPDAYLAVLDFLDRLANIAGTPYNCIIVAPGNHDVSRAAITGNRLEHDAIFAHARDQNYIETLYAKGQLMDYARKIGRDFFATSNLFEQQWIDPFVCTVSIPDRHLSILAINSTLCCTAAGSETDLGNLAIPITAVDRALSAIPNSHLVMSVCHHPFSHLTEGTGRNLRTALSHRSRAHFFGHLHDPLPQYVITPGGETMSLQAGALYVKPSTFLGYSVLRVTDRGEHPQVGSRWYMEGRRVFDDATNVCAHGVFYPNAAAQAYWDSQLPKINKTIFGKWLREEAYIELKKEHNTTFNGMPLEDIFVFPPLARSNRGVEDASVEGSAQAEEIWSIVDVLERPENILILVPNKSGATSLLSFLALQQSKGGPRQSTPRIPLLVDIRGIRPYPAQALRALRQAHPQVDHENYGWRRLAHLHPYLVLVDNFDPENQDHGTALALLHTTVPNAKFIIATRTNLSAPEKISIDFKLSFSYLLLNLLPFGRRKVRDLVRKWTLPPAYPENHVVEQILDRFRALNIPLTGPHISMFLMVLAEQKNFSPINQSTVIENFVERLLEKPIPKRFFARRSISKRRPKCCRFLPNTLSDGTLVLQPCWS